MHANVMLIGAENTASQNIKICNFAHKFAPEESIFARFLQNYQHLVASSL